MEKKAVTFYLEPNVKKLIDHLYALKIINGHNCSRGDIVTEAILLLAQRDNIVEIHECEGEVDG